MRRISGIIPGPRCDLDAPLRSGSPTPNLQIRDEDSMKNAMKQYEKGSSRPGHSGPGVHRADGWWIDNPVISSATLLSWPLPKL